jgi:ubiquitin conjugation factor E4 B
MAGLTQLYDPEFLFRSNTFTSFVITWLIRYADPRKSHPKPIVEYVFGLPLPLYLLSHSICYRLPLPKEVPLDFRVLPEYILEDVIDYLFFAVRYALVPFVMKAAAQEGFQTWSIQPRVDRQGRGPYFYDYVHAVNLVDQESVLEK